MITTLRTSSLQRAALRRLTFASHKLLTRGTASAAEVNSDASSSSESKSSEKEGLLFVDSVFPVRLGTWDLRHYVGIFREDYLTSRLEEIFNSVESCRFQLQSVEPRIKDGGVFVKFKYDATEEDHALDDILRELREKCAKKGGFPSWTGLSSSSGDVWPVRGQPWREDLYRFASPILKVSFEGPDVREENLYDVLRPFGRIADISAPQPGPSGALRYSIVTFRQVRSAVTAHNCIHSIAVPVGNSFTRLHTAYERPLRAHAIRDWITGHPRIVIPIVVFLLGTLTYTIFDPIRVFSVEGRMLDWFNLRNTAVFKWVRKNTIDRLSFAISRQDSQGNAQAASHIWKEREAAEADVRAYLSDFPGTVTFVHGPQGSGKSRMLFSLLKENERPVLTIDCAELYKASSDSALLTSLARQTGYWPVFPFINSMNNLIDIATVGLIGQKAGLSTSIEEQVRQILEVVGTGLKAVSARKKQNADSEVRRQEEQELRQREEELRRAKIRLGIWHDGRIDCIAGNGVMSELGYGDEMMRPEDCDAPLASPENLYMKSVASTPGSAQVEKEPETRPKTPSDTQALKVLPIVIIKNFATKRGKDNVIDVLAKWAATLVNNQVAHVIVVSDNRENAKTLAQALPTKPLHSVALSDADSSSALEYVMQKLREDGLDNGLTADQRRHVERLGGRASDLESLVHKVRSGQPVEVAVEDIVSRSVSEIQKNAFGDDAEDAASLPWTREQAWAVVKQLSKAKEISYHETLMNFPFSGDETALRSMEHAELITIGTREGRPSNIKPGRPVYRLVFEKLVADPVFRAQQDIASNERRIASAEKTIRLCEEELLNLHNIGTASAHWWSKRTATSIRFSYLMKKLQAAEVTLEKLEASNVELKKILAKNE